MRSDQVFPEVCSDIWHTLLTLSSLLSHLLGSLGGLYVALWSFPCCSGGVTLIMANAQPDRFRHQMVGHVRNQHL